MQKFTCRSGVIAVITCMLLTFIFTGCKAPEQVMTIDGYTVTDGVYLMAQLNAYNLIYPDYYGSEDFFAETDEDGTSVVSLIETETMNSIYKLAYANKHFDSAGKTLTEEQQMEFEFSLTFSYSQAADYLAQNGIGEQSYTDYSLAFYKFDLLFQELYDNDGEKQPTDTEIKDYFSENYAPVTIISVPLVASDYSTLEEDVLAEQHEIAGDMVEALEDGDELEEVIKEYLPKAYENALMEELDEEMIEQYYSEDLVSVESTAYTEEQVQEILAKSAGDVGMVESYSSVIVYVVEEDDEELVLGDYRSSLIYEMFYEEFETAVFAEASGYNLEKDSSAIKHYSPKNIV